jgi:cytochrome c oxidase subunit IV
MENTHKHITSYRTYGIILVALLTLTALTVTVTWINAGRFAIAIAIGIACMKSSLVLLYFMHLKFDLVLFRILVGIVFFLILIVFIVTFFDYMFR